MSYRPEAIESLSLHPWVPNAFAPLALMSRFQASYAPVLDRVSESVGTKPQRLLILGHTEGTLHHGLEQLSVLRKCTGHQDLIDVEGPNSP